MNMNIIGIIILVVVVAALTAYIAWKLLHNKTVNALKNNDTKAANDSKSSIVSNQNEGGAEIAAIGMALHLYLNDSAHDDESNVITIKRIQRRYSPWSSKIYSMNNFQ
jgi:glutaconyl-CoA/methylmalonyl-CoA decarboxylase subunit delta